MSKFPTTLICSLFVLFCSCIDKKEKLSPFTIESVSMVKERQLPIENKDNDFWYHKDIFQDTIPGISLEKAYSEFLKNKAGKEVIVAVIDMSVDIDHIDLKESIWYNDDEIADNGIDDDDNGYVDDINGWNFLGYKDGGASEFVNYEYTRIIKKYSERFDGKNENEIEREDLDQFKTYLKAKQKYSERMEYAKSSYDNDLGTYEYALVMKEALEPFFPNSEYDLNKLDSLGKVFKGQEPISTYIADRITFDTYGITEDYILESKIKSEERINKLLNLEYNDRELIGDDESDIDDTDYGNNVVNSNVKRMDHGTSTAGTIAAVRDNLKGAMGVSDNIKIMPIVISGFGDEHDKDMALAIRYAVDNGASVINISSGKYFSLHEGWVHDAMRYAEKNNVIIVNAAGNSNNKLDIDENYFYPNDYDGKKEISNTFLKIGSSSFDLSDLKDPDSNYSKEHVDLFAPGVDIYTLDSSDGGYKTVSGTSSAAALTSGVAALVWSYYPNLTASELKYILINSGVSFNVMTNLNEDSDENERVPFKDLSKSGKILNAYYALKMAEKMNQN